jgi:hypothetical protein
VSSDSSIVSSSKYYFAYGTNCFNTHNCNDSQSYRISDMFYFNQTLEFFLAFTENSCYVDCRTSHTSIPIHKSTPKNKIIGAPTISFVPKLFFLYSYHLNFSIIENIFAVAAKYFDNLKYVSVTGNILLS